MSVVAATAATNALEVQGVGVHFGGFKAVDGVNLTIAPGERRAILGPNGAGKTTLFNVLTGDVKASEGRVLMFGEEITGEPVNRRIQRGLRRTYQHANLFDGLTVRDTLFLAVAGVRGGWAQVFPIRAGDARCAEAERLAEIAGVTALLQRTVSELSHGQRRQLEIGIALAENPRVLLLDEPAAGLSPAERPMLCELLTSLPKEVAVVLIEHDMDIALTTSESVSVLFNGSLLAEGTPADITQNPDVRRVYIGDQT